MQLGEHRMERELRRVRRVAAAVVDGRGSIVDRTRPATHLTAATDWTMAESTAAGCRHAHRPTRRLHSMHGCALTSRANNLRAEQRHGSPLTLLGARCSGRLCDAMASLVPLIACLDDHALEAAVPWLRQPMDLRVSNDGGPFSAVKSTFVRPGTGLWSVRRRATALCQLTLLACFAALSMGPLATLATHACNFSPPVAARGGHLMLVNAYGDDSGLMSLPPEVQRYASNSNVLFVTLASTASH